MKTTTPIPVLKRRARGLAQADGIPLHQALDQVARSQGYVSWSLLASQQKESTDDTLLSKLVPGDLVLLGARPGQGKTLMGLRLLAEHALQDAVGYFFTLEYTVADVASRLKQMGFAPHNLGGRFVLDTADAINADYIINRVQGAAPGTIIVVDYLQLLDQRRVNPDLTTQVAALRDCAANHGFVIVLLTQIDRSYDRATKPIPDLQDVRLPNPLDLNLFTKGCFIGDGGVAVIQMAS
ncbi:MAG: DNA helicase [Pseudomonadota bacterium]